MSAERADETVVAYDNFEPDEEGLREALTSTGNGYFCTRGAAEWEDAGGAHYPGTYARGGFNRETTVMGGRPVLNEDLVNLPNWLVLKLRIEGDDAGAAAALVEGEDRLGRAAQSGLTLRSGASERVPSSSRRARTLGSSVRWAKIRSLANR